jgi:hypothetical protein
MKQLLLQVRLQRALLVLIFGFPVSLVGGFSGGYGNRRGIILDVCATWRAGQWRCRSQRIRLGPCYCPWTMLLPLDYAIALEPCDCSCHAHCALLQPVHPCVCANCFRSPGISSCSRATRARCKRYRFLGKSMDVTSLTSFS